jgi:hypothetical protein
VIIFFLSLPLCNPWVRGDGVGYYAYVRSLLIDHSLNFEKDWTHGNESFAMGRVDATGKVRADQYTPTGHIDNHWTVGPSILWSPFLVAAHIGVLVFDKLGGHVPADGFSRPYVITMACATAFYGFLGLWLSFALARKYFHERWAFLATLGIWWASSLPVYMYFNPSWSHAHSAFAGALFLWYWHRTRGSRSLGQWILLALISGLMVNVYYLNGVLLLLPLFEALAGYYGAWKSGGAARSALAREFFAHCAYLLVFLLALLPTFITRAILYGSPFQSGYTPVDQWLWKSPALFGVLFSSDHGMFSWTPILLFAFLGLFLFRRQDKSLALSLIVSFVIFYVVVALHEDWDGLSSFGNRRFITFTPAFILGLTAVLDWAARKWAERRTAILAGALTSAFVLWNLGLIFQWGTHLIPARGPISFRDATYNQFTVVPRQAGHTLKNYFTRRGRLMNRIEQEDVNQLKKQQPEGSQ